MMISKYNYFISMPAKFFLKRNFLDLSEKSLYNSKTPNRYQVLCLKKRRFVVYKRSQLKR